MGDRGGGLFAAEQVSRGRYGPDPGEDGGTQRRARKPVVRKTVDLAASTLNFIRDREFAPTLYVRAKRPLPPTSDAAPALTLPRAPGRTSALRSPAEGFATKFITHSINKARTPITVCTFTPDTRRVVTGASSGEITLWHGLTFNFETIIQGHDDVIRSMAWGGGGNCAVLASGDDSGVIKLWQTSMNNLKAFKAHKASVRDVCFAPNSHGERMVSCSDDHTISVWDTERAKEVVGITGHGWDIKSAHWHPTHSLIATGSKDSSVKLWDPRSGNELTMLHGHKNTVNKVRFNYLNGHWLASCGRDRMIKVWDLRTMKEISSHRDNEKELTCLEWHPQFEEMFTTGAFDGDIRHWLVGEPLHAAEIRQAHDKEVNSIAWHPLGHLLVSVANDQVTRYWARNKPGDDMTDKYNVSSLSGASKTEAIMELVEAQRLNPQQQRMNDARRFALEEQAIAMAQQVSTAGSTQRGTNSLPLGFASETSRMEERHRELKVKQELEDRRAREQRQHPPPPPRSMPPSQHNVDSTTQQQQIIDERARFEREMLEKYRRQQQTQPPPPPPQSQYDQRGPPPGSQHPVYPPNAQPHHQQPSPSQYSSHHYPQQPLPQSHSPPNNYQQQQQQQQQQPQAQLSAREQYERELAARFSRQQQRR